MHKDVAIALELQTIDHRIAELRREIATLPRQIAAIENALVSRLKRLEMDKAALAANQRERKRLDGEVATQQQKISKLRDQMLQAKSNDQYRAFQHEIDFCEQSIRKCEDQTLDLMGEAEALEKNVAVAEVSLAAEKKVVAAERVKAQARTAEDKVELAKAEAEYATHAQQMSVPMLTYYQRLRSRYYKEGDVVAEVKNSICRACMMQMRPQYFQDVKSGEKVLTCDTCRRILYYDEPAVDVDAQMNG